MVKLRTGRLRSELPGGKTALGLRTARESQGMVTGTGTFAGGPGSTEEALREIEPLLVTKAAFDMHNRRRCSRAS